MPDKEVIKDAKKHGEVRITNNPKEVVKDADVILTTNPRHAVKEAGIVYTDTRVSLGQEKQKARKIKAFKGYQVNKKLISLGNNALFMHCLPAHRGYEVTDDVIDSERSIVFDQAENRLFAQQAVILKLLNRI